MLLKCCTQYVSKFGKLSSGCRTGNDQFSFQSQRKAMPKDVQVKVKVNQSGLYSPRNSPGPNTRVGSLSLSRRYSQPRDQTQVSCIEGRFFTSRATREAQECSNYCTIVPISHATKVMLKILQARLQQLEKAMASHSSPLA